MWPNFRRCITAFFWDEDRGFYRMPAAFAESSAKTEVISDSTQAAAGEAITEDTVVSGTFKMFYNWWGTYCSVPFSIKLKAPLPEYTETVSTSDTYANYGGNEWNVEPLPVEATIGPREKYTLALANSYWAMASVSGYSETPTVLVPTFTNGEGLLEFSVKIAAGPVWGGANCELLTVIPTDAAYALTEDTTVTGTVRIYWRGFCDMPFSITIDVPEEETPECQHENTGYVDNKDGTHSVVCECGEVVSTEDHKYENNACACGHALVNLGTSATLALEEMIELNFVVYTDQLVGEGIYAEITHTYANGNEPDVVILPMEDWVPHTSSGGRTRAKVPYTNIAAKEMGDVITLVVYNVAGQQLSIARTDGVQLYVKRALGAASIAANEKKLLADALNYGAAAQVKFNYDANNLVNGGELAALVNQYASTAAVTVTNNQIKGLNAKGATLSLESAVQLNATFNVSSADIANLYAVATYTGFLNEEKTVEITSEMIAEATGTGATIKVPVPGMAAGDFRQMVNVKVYNNGELVGEVTESIESYMARALGAASIDEVEKDVYRAQAKFSQSAYDFFRAKAGL